MPKGNFYIPHVASPAPLVNLIKKIGTVVYGLDLRDFPFLGRVREEFLRENKTNCITCKAGRRGLDLVLLFTTEMNLSKIVIFYPYWP